MLSDDEEHQSQVRLTCFLECLIVAPLLFEAYGMKRTFVLARGANQISLGGCQASSWYRCRVSGTSTLKEELVGCCKRVLDSSRVLTGDHSRPEITGVDSFKALSRDINRLAHLAGGEIRINIDKSVLKAQERAGTVHALLFRCSMPKARRASVPEQ